MSSGSAEAPKPATSAEVVSKCYIRVHINNKDEVCLTWPVFKGRSKTVTACQTVQEVATMAAALKEEISGVEVDTYVCEEVKMASARKFSD